MGLGHACGNRPDSGLCHELHGDACARIDLLEVIDELGQILDRVDVVVRGRRDEGDAGD